MIRIPFVRTLNSSRGARTKRQRVDLTPCRPTPMGQAGTLVNRKIRIFLSLNSAKFAKGYQSGQFRYHSNPWILGYYSSKVFNFFVSQKVIGHTTREFWQIAPNLLKLSSNSINFRNLYIDSIAQTFFHWILEKFLSIYKVPKDTGGWPKSPTPILWLLILWLCELWAVNRPEQTLFLCFFHKNCSLIFLDRFNCRN